jgi:RNA methyltransferase, TrmH family
MLSKATIKFIKSLQVKKYRKQEQCFIVEGAKSVKELLASDFEVLKLLATDDFLASVPVNQTCEIIPVREGDLNGLGDFQSNNSALAIASIKPNGRIDVSPTEFALVLDDIRDPGNLGTMIRTADWFGFNKIICSEETADFYNPKVISSTMGSFTRVEIYYTDLAEYLQNTTLPVWGGYLDGDDIHTVKPPDGALVLIGSESHGISPSLEKYVTQRITIPKFGQAESLNAAIAAAIICDNIRRIKP